MTLQSKAKAATAYVYNLGNFQLDSVLVNTAYPIYATSYSDLSAAVTAEIRVDNTAGKLTITFLNGKGGVVGVFGAPQGTTSPLDVVSTFGPFVCTFLPSKFCEVD